MRRLLQITNTPSITINIEFVMAEHQYFRFQVGGMRRQKHVPTPGLAALPSPATFSLCCAVCEKMVVMIDLSVSHLQDK